MNICSFIIKIDMLQFLDYYKANLFSYKCAIFYVFLSVNNADIIVICYNFRKGKAKPFEILKKDEAGKFIKMFTDIGNKD